MKRKGTREKVRTALCGLCMTAVALAVTCIIAACQDDINLTLEQQKTGFKVVGDPVQVHLSVAVNGISVDATRAEEPTADADNTANDEENHIDDLWFFVYDATTKELVDNPQRIEITDQEQLNDIDVTLADNNGSPVIVYVVANAGSGKEEDSKNWVVYNSTTESYDGFMSIDDLEANAIPTPHPQMMKWDEGEGKYVLDNQEISAISIPMSGSKKNVTIKANTGFTVYVDRMFAKVLVKIDLSDFEGEGLTQTVLLNNVTIGNIPEYCTVGTLWDGDKTDGSQMGDYSNCSSWLQRTFTYDESAEGSDESVYPYLIYIPENVQGENQVDGSTDKAKNAPIPEGSSVTRALTATVSIYVTSTSNGNETTMGPYPYTVYPGGNTTTNFNVRRNCIYRVSMKIGYPISLDMLPSANCIICPSGETTAFWPYYRTEEGGGYDFEDYLYAYDDEAKKGQKIDHVGIIWQSTDGGNTVDYDDTATGYIGDNSNNEYVWIDDLDNGEATDEYHRRIYVSIPAGKTGNALIAAYNSDDEIIWSWHIWSRARANDPTTVNTKLYYTYDWDNDSIYGYYSTRPRVAGYTIMNCNLGAMQDDPAGSVYVTRGNGTDGFNNARPTFGTLYQWGRKDPFPPITAHIAVENAGGTYGIYEVYEEYSDTTVGRYFDNENKAVAIVGKNTSDALFHSVGGSARKVFDEMIPLTIQNPTVFYAGTNNVNYLNGLDPIQNQLADFLPTPKDGNWILDSESDHFNRLWGGLDPEKDSGQFTKSYDTGLTCTIGNTSNIPIHIYDDYGEKSIFDPCPYGWRVSPPDLWLGFTYTGLNPVSTGTLEDINYDIDDTKSNYPGMTMYVTAWREGETSFFPCQGTRAPDGCAFRSGQCGNYNNATADANDRVNTLHIHNTANEFKIFENGLMEYHIKSSAGPLRCVRIDSVQQ